MAFTGCESQNSIYQEKLKRDKFIEREFSEEKHASAKEKSGIKTYYYNEITSGNVVAGMSLMEAKMASKTYPYGSNRGNIIFWCEEKVVDVCAQHCAICAAVLFGKKQTHFLQGKGHSEKTVVVKSLPSHRNDTVFHFRSKPYSVVSALFRNQIVEGMDLTDYQRITPFPATRQQFFCKNQRVFQNCLFDYCTDCTVRLITPAESQYRVKSVRFRGNSDFKTIVDVKESIQASIQ